MTNAVPQNPKTPLKKKMHEFSKKLEEWKGVLAKSPDCLEAKKKVAIYEKLISQLKFNLKYLGRRHKKRSTTKKWSPVLSGSFENGKRR